MVIGGEATTLWARAFTDELARAGVREVALAPGSRSTPLVLAMAADERFCLRVHLDERSAGFFALGVGKRDGTPAAVLTTSGTAAANLLPAVVEAARSQAPLLVLTADRPHRLRDADANQAIDQVRLYGGYPVAFFDLAAPSLEGPALRHLRAVACRAVAAARGRPAGPVHVNVPLDKPLEPTADTEASVAFAAAHPLSATGRPDGAPFVEISPARAVLDHDRWGWLAACLAGAGRGVLVAGPSAEPWRDGSAVLELAAATGMPLLADPLSGARFAEPRGADRVSCYDIFLRTGEVRDRLVPDLIVRVGASPTSSALQQWLAEQNGVRHVVIDGGGVWKDHAAIVTDYLVADVSDTMREMARQASPTTDHAWREAWRSACDAARGACRISGDQEPHEGLVLTRVVDALPTGSTLFVSNSMAVRDLDAFVEPRARDLHVLGNRGASGIDGVVSTAFGVAAASRRPTVCVLGDLAFFHDQNGLLWAREADAPVVFVLVDNDGGGIFHMLPVREHEPHFTTYFATPHGLDLSHAARMHGVPLVDATVSAVGPAVQSALEGRRTAIIRVKTDREEGRRRRGEVADGVARSVLHALG